jgi:hydrogenase maturation factor
VIDLGERYLVAKSDPITFATDEIGWYAVHVNANDVACMGASPRWFLATLLLPGGLADAAMVESIFEQIRQGCQQVGAVLVGGHTEITYGLDRPVLVGGMLGEVAPERLVTTGGAQVGDAILLTKRVAVEATAIIAREKRAELLDRFDAAILDRCARFLHEPGISVVPDARIVTQAVTPHAMHDPTEGGLATGLWELAQAANVGLEIDPQAVPVYPETRQLCAAFDLDPWGVIASGSLLVTLPPGQARRAIEALEQEGIEASLIGRVVPSERGVTLGGKRRPLPSFARDEIARLFEDG